MRWNVAVLVLLSAAPVLAHEGVKNPAVMARMHGMKDIAADVKTLGQMAKGAITFDQAAARAAAASIAQHAAAASIAQHAAAAPGLFEAPEDDPKSEALPAIWENFDDFRAKSLELETIALGLSTSIESADDLRPALKALGDNCSTCHEVYRKQN